MEDLRPEGPVWSPTSVFCAWVRLSQAWASPGPHFLIPLTLTLSTVELVYCEITNTQTRWLESQDITPTPTNTSLLEIHEFPFPRSTLKSCSLNPVLVAFNLGN